MTGEPPPPPVTPQGQTPPGQPPRAPAAYPPPPWSPQPPYAPYPAPERRGGGISTVLAVVFAILFFLSAALNLVLFFGLVATAAAAGGAGASAGPDRWVEHVVGGDEHAEDRILVLDVEGVISEAVSSFSGAGYGSVTQIRKALEAAERDPRIKGVLLHVNSPGGGVTDSDEIFKLISDYKQEHGKPVAAIFGALAASGGYYVGAAADHIVAEPTTITGSIGVIVSTWKYHEAANELGLKPETFISGDTPYKDMLSGARPTREDERAIVLGIVQEMYERFVTVVDTGRKDLTREDVKALADGRIYTAIQARESKLVDEIGYADQAVGWVKREAGIAAAKLVKFRPSPSLLDVLTGRPAYGGAGGAAGILGALPLHLHLRTPFLYLWSGS